MLKSQWRNKKNDLRVFADKGATVNNSSFGKFKQKIMTVVFICIYFAKLFYLKQLKLLDFSSFVGVKESVEQVF